MQSVSYTQTYEFLEDLCLTLISEDENKGKDSDSLVKILNKLILAILEKGHSTKIFLIIFDILINTRRKVNYSKLIGMAVKCLVKLTRVLKDIMPEVQPTAILEKITQYLDEFVNENSRPTEDIGIKVIKTIICEFSKMLGEKIWDYFPKQMEKSHILGK